MDSASIMKRGYWIVAAVVVLALIAGAVVFSTLRQEIVIRVVDGTGSPVPEVSAYATIVKYSKGVRFMNWGEAPERSEVVLETDADGEVRFESPGRRAGLVVTLSKVGYFDETRRWYLKDMPVGPVVIVMEEKRNSVPMIVGAYHTSGKGGDVVSGGVKLDYGDHRAGSIALADVWFKIVKGKGSSSWEKRVVKIRAQNGWEIRSETEHGAMDSCRMMQVAPLSGYSIELEFPVARCPSGFYLRSEGGKRYGKICHFELKDRGLKGEKSNIWFRLSFAVQKDVDCGRSLNRQ